MNTICSYLDVPKQLHKIFSLCPHLYLCITSQCYALLWKIFHSILFWTNFPNSLLNYYLSHCTDLMLFLIGITVFSQRRKTANSISEQDIWVAEKGIIASFMDKEVSGPMNRFQGGPQTWAIAISSYWNGLNNTQNYEIEKKKKKETTLLLFQSFQFQLVACINTQILTQTHSPPYTYISYFCNVSCKGSGSCSACDLCNNQFNWDCCSDCKTKTLVFVFQPHSQKWIQQHIRLPVGLLIFLLNWSLRTIFPDVQRQITMLGSLCVQKGVGITASLGREVLWYAL